MGAWLLVVYVFMGSHPLVGKIPGFDTLGECWQAGSILTLMSHEAHPGFSVAKMCINTEANREPKRDLPAGKGTPI
jgi:hypothetical protein